jgi:hypothetical protein
MFRTAIFAAVMLSTALTLATSAAFANAPGGGLWSDCLYGQSGGTLIHRRRRRQLFGQGPSTKRTVRPRCAVAAARTKE